MILCPRCGSQSFWWLSTGQKRCKKCHLTRKFGKTIWQRTRISPYWKGKLVEFFCLGVPAYRLRFQVPLDRRTIQRWFRILRETIYQQTMQELQAFSGKIEMDETIKISNHHLVKPPPGRWNRWNSLTPREFWLENRNSNITTQLASIIKAFSDFRLVAQIRKEIEKVKPSHFRQTTTIL